MSSDKKDFTVVPALWFDKNGCGPSELAFHLRSFVEPRGFMDALGIQVKVNDGGMVGPRAGELIGAGFLIHRDQVADLHRQLGEWLASLDTEEAA